MTTAQLLTQKSPKDIFVRKSMLLLDVKVKLEIDIVRMKEKKVHPDAIAVRDQMVDDVIEFYNLVADLIDNYELVIKHLKAQNTIVEGMFIDAFCAKRKSDDAFLELIKTHLNATKEK